MEEPLWTQRACLQRRYASTVALAFPPPLLPGDAIAVVAPSSPCSREKLLRGLAWLRSRYRILMSPGVFARDAYLAGDDAHRATALARALADRDVKAIVAACGGYGSLRLLADLPWDTLSSRPSWIAGYSDITALHASAWRVGVASVHAPNVVDLGAAASAAGPAARAAWLAALERPVRSRAWRGLRVIHGGQARGVLVGGNLSLIHALATAGRLAIPPQAVVVLEDVDEAPYRVDRMLTSLILGGHLSHASALVFGGFDRSTPGPAGRSVDEVLDERSRLLGIPVLAGAPFGHGSANEAFVLGSDVQVREGAVFWEASS
jgi:muramoyltetrapeptide carboxypeptidase